MFADHYQFYVLDGECSPYEAAEAWSDEAVKRGYIDGEQSIRISTIA